MASAPALRLSPPTPSAPNSRVTVAIAGRHLEASPVFETYWRFAAARQRLFFSKVADRPDQAPTDSILREHRFTNCYRASDRVSQFVIKEVAYSGDQNLDDLVFRVLLFKLFNKIETWRLLDSALGPISWKGWQPERARAVLDSAWAAGRRLYSPAYVIPPGLPNFSGLRSGPRGRGQVRPPRRMGR